MSNQGPTVVNDRYEIRSRIGRGGMADVFLAQDRLLDRPVAVKVLFPEYAADPAFVERFRREAQAAANLSHPNIVGVYDWGRVGTTYFIVMEYVQGRPLSDVLRTDGPLMAQRATDIAADVAAALGFAHRNGVVHRDIKPGNILVSPSGGVKVADFGIARALNSAVEQDLTQAGAVMGTATYFSPEQAQGLNPDPRSDLYSLGIVMYEMAAGRPPFVGDNPVAIAYKQVHETPPTLIQVKRDVPRGYDAIVAKLLAKRPEGRYQTADELRADLRRFREGQPVAAMAVAGVAAANSPVRVAPTQIVATSTVGMRTGPQPTYTEYDDRRGRSAWWLLAGILGLVLVGLAGWFLFQAIAGNNEVPPARISVPDLRGKPLDQAKLEATAAGLKPVERAEVNDEVPVGTVWNQDPVGGTAVDKDTEVTLVFNPGRQNVSVPNLLGRSVDDAESTLTALKLPYEVLERESNEASPGVVIGQDPPAGEVPAGTKITITASIGLGQVEVPNVIGLDQVAAASQLAGKGFQVNTTQEPNDSVGAGKVIRTDPPANTMTDPGSTVTIVVSSGPPPVKVPAVEGLTESVARDTLQQAGLLQRVVYQDVPSGSDQSGRVIAQSIPPTTEVPKGSTVVITVGKPLAPTTTTTEPPTTEPPTTQPTTTTTTTTVPAQTAEGPSTSG
jgi:eukaryotic-like serine/threonine-protein kinase